jgi:hypothetical protein
MVFRPPCPGGKLKGAGHLGSGNSRINALCPSGREGIVIIALVSLFGAGYVWHSTLGISHGPALVVNRGLALMYLFIGELALIATLAK